MPIKFRCTKCKQFLGISREKAGAVVDCPTCGRTIRVPSLDGSVAPVPEPKLEVDDPRLSEALDELAALGSGVENKPKESTSLPTTDSESAVQSSVPSADPPAAEAARQTAAVTDRVEPPSVEESRSNSQPVDSAASRSSSEPQADHLTGHEQADDAGSAVSDVQPETRTVNVERPGTQADAATDAIAADESPVVDAAIPAAVRPDHQPGGGESGQTEPELEEPELIETPELVEDDEFIDEPELIEDQDDDLFDVDPVESRRRREARKERPKRSKSNDMPAPQAGDLLADDGPEQQITGKPADRSEDHSSDVIVDDVVNEAPEPPALGELLDAETLEELSKIGDESAVVSQSSGVRTGADLKDPQAPMELAEEIPIAIPEPVDDLPEPVAVPVPKAESVQATPATESDGLDIADAFAELADLNTGAVADTPADIPGPVAATSRGLPVGIIVSAALLAFAAGFGGGWITGKVSSNSEATDVELEADSDGEAGDRDDAGNGNASQPLRLPEANDGEAVVRGRISLGIPGMAMAPDDSARVLILPRKRQGTLRIPAIALLAASNSADFEVARNAIQLMGGYLAVVDSDGRFESVVQGSGEFMLVAVSQTESLTNPQFLEANAIRALEPFFEAPSEVLEQRMHHTFDLKLTAGTSQEWVCVLGEPGTHAKPEE